MFKQKMVALKPFVFRGEMLNVDEELEPETPEQAALLRTIGFADHKPRRGYRIKPIQPAVTTVMTATEA